MLFKHQRDDAENYHQQHEDVVNPTNYSIWTFSKFDYGKDFFSIHLYEAENITSISDKTATNGQGAHCASPCRSRLSSTE